MWSLGFLKSCPLQFSGSAGILIWILSGIQNSLEPWNACDDAKNTASFHCETEESKP